MTDDPHSTPPAPPTAGAPAGRAQTSSPKPEKAEVSAVTGWVLLGLGAALCLIAGFGQDTPKQQLVGLALALVLLAGGLAQIVYVGVREQRELHAEMRRRLSELERLAQRRDGRG